METEKKTWWERWGKIASVLAVTAGLIGGVAGAAVHVSKLEARAAKVDELMSAMQNLREVLLKNGIEWSPAEFPPVRPIAMSMPPRAVPGPDELHTMLTFLAGQLTHQQMLFEELTRRVKRLEEKNDPFPLVPRRTLDVLPIRPPGVDGGP